MALFHSSSRDCGIGLHLMSAWKPNPWAVFACLGVEPWVGVSRKNTASSAGAGSIQSGEPREMTQLYEFYLLS